jgi:glutathione synthase/RimK-type ligase-like ATP-grasp enzyme
VLTPDELSSDSNMRRARFSAMLKSMGEKKIAFATWKSLPDLSEDDRLVIGPLAARGIRVQGAVWDDPSVRWGDFDAVIVRSTWDYTARVSEFMGWVARLELNGVRLYNPSAVLYWNSSKTYLRELERAHLKVVPTFWLTAGGTAAMLDELARRVVTDQFVLKPAVSAGAARTHLFSRADLQGAGEPTRRAELESALADYEPGSMVLAQPYLDEIAQEGEWSFLYYGGRFSHCVLKKPNSGDFRVQLEFGGQMSSVVPSPAGLAAAEQAYSLTEKLMACALLYARVDLIRQGEDWLLGEIEALEPSLYLAQDPGAADRFAEAIAKKVGTTF